MDKLSITSANRRSKF